MLSPGDDRAARLPGPRRQVHAEIRQRPQLATGGPPEGRLPEGSHERGRRLHALDLRLLAGLEPALVHQLHLHPAGRQAHHRPRLPHAHLVPGRHGLPRQYRRPAAQHPVASARHGAALLAVRHLRRESDGLPAREPRRHELRRRRLRARDGHACAAREHEANRLEAGLAGKSMQQLPSQHLNAVADANLAANSRRSPSHSSRTTAEDTATPSARSPRPTAATST